MNVPSQGREALITAMLKSLTTPTTTAATVPHGTDLEDIYTSRTMRRQRRYVHVWLTNSAVYKVSALHFTLYSLIKCMK